MRSGSCFARLLMRYAEDGVIVAPQVVACLRRVHLTLHHHAAKQVYAHGVATDLGGTWHLQLGGHLRRQRVPALRASKRIDQFLQDLVVPIDEVRW